MRDFIVIAHRGASGYLPEHTLEGVALAHAMGADYIEQDVLLTRDDQLVVLHDLTLDAVTDVAQRFPGRNRADGRHYAIDFTLAEIRTLSVHERTGPDGRAAFPDRFPASDNLFRVPTFEEEIRLIQGLNRTTGRDVGIYVEPKSPAWHDQEGKDLVAAVIAVLKEYGYSKREDRVFLQSFDMGSLKRARYELGSDLKLVQLIGENSWKESATDFNYLQTPEGLAEIAAFASGIGPWLPQVIEIDKNGSSDISELVELAHQNGLFVHAYTLRADQLPAELGGMSTAVKMLLDQTGLDGVFTDHPDQVIEILKAVKGLSGQGK